LLEVLERTKKKEKKMTLIRYNPFRELETFSDRMKSFFEDFPTSINLDASSNFNPRIDISDDEKTVFVNVELPGVDKKDVKISVQENNILTIKGEKKTEIKDEKKNFYRVERTYGSFCRTMALPVDVNAEKTKAKYENGILTIELPKLEPTPKSEKLIEIN
jgi:HSP20 family protein